MKQVFKVMSSSGFVLMGAVIVSLVLSNTSLNKYYLDALNIKLAIVFGQYALSKPLLLWINDGMMAIFFLYVGLELKRELIMGHLADKANIMLPIIGATGGLVCPALVFYFFNADNPTALKGWAIPAATDIAFALAVLSLLSDKIPKSAKIFLLTLAIFDDLAAIVIIAIFYTSDISLEALLLSSIAIISLGILNKSKVSNTTAYILIGIFLWVCVLKSGVHATLAGVITALFVPIKETQHISPLHKLEHSLSPWVAFLILPVFALANSGFQIAPLLEKEIFNPVTLGSGLGLLIGKQIGVFTSCFLAIKLFKLKLPPKMCYMTLYGIALITGIGFTMSLFISSLAYGDHDFEYMMSSRLGIIVGSVLSAAAGYLVLLYAHKRQVVARARQVKTK